MDLGSETQHQVMGYDRAAQTFSPSGHILQVEYAGKAAKLGSTSIGILCKNGVVIVSDKKFVDRLIQKESASKIYEIDSHIMASAAGILADARVLIEDAQVLAQRHHVSYDSSIDVESIMREIAGTQQKFTQFGGGRPFGVAIMVAGISDGKAQLYSSDITGNYLSYKATAIGEKDEEVKEMLRKEYVENVSTDDGLKLAIKIFKKILGEDFDLERLDVGVIKTDKAKLEKIEGKDLKKYE